MKTIEEVLDYVNTASWITLSESETEILRNYIGSLEDTLDDIQSAADDHKFD